MNWKQKYFLEQTRRKILELIVQKDKLLVIRDKNIREFERRKAAKAIEREAYREKVRVRKIAFIQRQSRERLKRKEIQREYVARVIFIQRKIRAFLDMARLRFKSDKVVQRKFKVFSVV